MGDLDEVLRTKGGRGGRSRHADSLLTFEEVLKVFKFSGTLLLLLQLPSPI